MFRRKARTGPDPLETAFNGGVGYTSPDGPNMRTKAEIIDDWATEAELEIITSWRASQIIEIMELLESPQAAKRMIKEIHRTNKVVGGTFGGIKWTSAAIVGGAALAAAIKTIYVIATGLFK